MFVDMNRRGLTDGKVHRLDFFLMERRTKGSHCKITTNMPLETVSSQISISAAFD